MIKQRKRLYKPLVSILSVVVSGLGLLVSPVQAQTTSVERDSLGNAAFVFSEDTVVEFEVKETHGAYQSTMGVVNLDTNEQTVLFRETKPYDSWTGQAQANLPENKSSDYLGTVEGGTLVNGRGEASSLIEFTFKAGTRYTLYLDSMSPTGVTRRTVQAINVNSAHFRGALDAGQNEDVVGTRISWDDQGLPRVRKDNDFNDFVVEAGGYLQTVPCVPVK